MAGEIRRIWGCQLSRAGTLEIGVSCSQPASLALASGSHERLRPIGSRSTAHCSTATRGHHSPPLLTATHLAILVATLQQVEHKQ